MGLVEIYLSGCWIFTVTRHRSPTVLEAVMLWLLWPVGVLVALFVPVKPRKPQRRKNG